MSTIFWTNFEASISIRGLLGFHVSRVCYFGCERDLLIDLTDLSRAEGPYIYRLDSHIHILIRLPI